MDKLPITFQMALAHTPNAMYEFLRLSNDEQDKIIKKATDTKSIMEIQALAENVAKGSFH